jgi:hypothetical protein
MPQHLTYLNRWSTIHDFLMHRRLLLVTFFFYNFKIMEIYIARDKRLGTVLMYNMSSLGDVVGIYTREDSLTPPVSN